MTASTRGFSSAQEMCCKGDKCDTVVGALASSPRADLRVGPRGGLKIEYGTARRTNETSNPQKQSNSG